MMMMNRITRFESLPLLLQTDLDDEELMALIKFLQFEAIAEMRARIKKELGINSPIDDSYGTSPEDVAHLDAGALAKSYVDGVVNPNTYLLRQSMLFGESN